MKKSWSKRNLWEAMPSAAKVLAGAVLGRLPMDFVLGKTFWKTRVFLAQSQWWSPEQIVDYQLTNVRRILGLAESRSSFYRDWFKRAGFEPAALHCLSDLQALPTMDKNTVIQNLEAMMTCSTKTTDLDYISTGGSTGTRMAFYAPAGRSAVEYAYLTTSWERSGYRLGDTMAVIRGRIVKAGKDGFRHEYDPLLRQHFYSNFHMTDGCAKAYLTHLGSLGPCVLHAYPSSASVLARVALLNPEVRPANLKAVLLESENVFPDQAALIEDAFAVRHFSCYGHCEKLVLASTCEHNNNYHVWPTYGYFELLDENGQSVRTPGGRGEIVGTGFINAAVPMIRYRTGDYATFVGTHCEVCGRNHTVLRDIAGRGRQACLIGIDGSEITMITSLAAMHDDCLRLVNEYQFLQDVPGEAKMFVIVARGWCEAERNRVEKLMNRRLQDQVRVTVVEMDCLHRTPRGKLLRVVSTRQIETYRNQT